METTTLHSTIWKEGNLYVDRCLEVNVASQGRTHDEAVNNLREALELYLEDSKEPLPEIKEAELQEVTV